MIGLLVVTHCYLGKELMNAAEFIVGKVDAHDYLSVVETTGSEGLRSEIAAKVTALDRGVV